MQDIKMTWIVLQNSAIYVK